MIDIVNINNNDQLKSSSDKITNFNLPTLSFDNVLQSNMKNDINQYKPQKNIYDPSNISQKPYENEFNENKAHSSIDDNLRVHDHKREDDVSNKTEPTKNNEKNYLSKADNNSKIDQKQLNKDENTIEKENLTKDDATLADIIISLMNISEEDLTKAEDSLKKIDVDEKINGAQKNNIKSAHKDDSNIFKKLSSSEGNDLQKIAKNILDSILNETREALKNENKGDEKVSKKLSALINLLEKKSSETKEQDVKLPLQVTELLEMLTDKKQNSKKNNSKSKSNDLSSTLNIKNDDVLSKAALKEILNTSENSSDNNSQSNDSKGNSLFHEMIKNENTQKQPQSLQNMKQSNFKNQMQQMIDNAKVYVKDSKNGTFTVKLYPKELGNVNVSLGLENGTLNGKFLVDTEGAKQLLMNNIEQFIQQLKDAGVDVGSFNVDVKDSKEQLFKEGENNKMLHSHNKEDQSAVAMEYNETSSLSHLGSINMVI